MDKKIPEKDKSFLSRWLLTADESIKLYINYGGCMGLIILCTLLLRWLVGILKVF